MFESVHPTVTARTGSCEDSRSDRAARQHHCKQCGFIVNAERVGSGEGVATVYPSATAEAISAGDGTITVDSTADFLASGDAIIYDDINPMHSEDFTYSSKTATEFTITSTIARDHNADCIIKASARVPVGRGCPLCGSRNWR